MFPSFFFFFFNVYLFLRDRERESKQGRGGEEREGDTESEACSRLQAVSTEPDTGLELPNCEVMTWAEVGCVTDWATQVPRLLVNSCILKSPYLKIFKCFLFIFERQRQAELEWGRGREQTGDTESEAGSRLWAVSIQPDTGLKLVNRKIRTWAEVGRLTDWATQGPLKFPYFRTPRANEDIRRFYPKCPLTS